MYSLLLLILQSFALQNYFLFKWRLTCASYNNNNNNNSKKFAKRKLYKTFVVFLCVCLIFLLHNHTYIHKSLSQMKRLRVNNRMMVWWWLWRWWLWLKKAKKKKKLNHPHFVVYGKFGGFGAERKSYLKLKGRRKNLANVCFKFYNKYIIIVRCFYLHYQLQ